jgi:hypothetical protein
MRTKMKKILMIATMRKQKRLLRTQMKEVTRILKTMAVKQSMKNSGKPLARISNLESLRIKQTEKNYPNYLGKCLSFKMMFYMC